MALRERRKTRVRFRDHDLCHPTDATCAERVSFIQQACARQEAGGYLEGARRCGETAYSPIDANVCAEREKRDFDERTRQCVEWS